MRKLILLPLLMSATPAFAQPPEVPRELTDPATADRITDGIQAVSQALLDLRVGALKAAVEGHSPTASDRRLTVRDLGRRGNPNFDRRLNQQIADAKPMIHQSMQTLNETLPAVMQELDQAQQSIERAIANMPDPTYPRR
jgi:hypothetical protein